MLVKFNAKRVLGFKEKLIIPGINDLAPELVADMMEDSILADKFDSGELEVIGADDVGASKVKTSVKGKAPTGVDVLLAASEKSALKLVGDTVDLKILEVWAMREKRSAVKKALNARISKIKNIEYRGEKKDSKFEKSDAGSEGDEE